MASLETSTLSATRRRRVPADPLPVLRLARMAVSERARAEGYEAENVRRNEQRLEDIRLKHGRYAMREACVDSCAEAHTWRRISLSNPSFSKEPSPSAGR